MSWRFVFSSSFSAFRPPTVQRLPGVVDEVVRAALRFGKKAVVKGRRERRGDGWRWRWRGLAKVSKVVGGLKPLLFTRFYKFVGPHAPLQCTWGWKNISEGCEVCVGGTKCLIFPSLKDLGISRFAVCWLKELYNSLAALEFGHFVLIISHVIPKEVRNPKKTSESPL